MSKYLLELNNKERLALQRTLKKVDAAPRDQETIDTLRGELSEMLPHFGIVIEVPDGVNSDDVTITTSLQMPLDVYITQRNGNSIEHVIKEPTRDPDRVHAIIASIGINSAAGPLLLAIEELRACLVEACENTFPDIVQLGDKLDDFANIFNEAHQKIHSLNPQR